MIKIKGPKVHFAVFLSTFFFCFIYLQHLAKDGNKFQRRQALVLNHCLLHLR